MVPYINIPSVKLFGLLPIQPFGVLVGVGIVIGYWLARARAKRVGLNPDHAGDAGVWGVVGGFVVGHWFSVIFYFPEQILENPLVLFAVWGGLSSFGGVVGGILGQMEIRLIERCKPAHGLGKVRIRHKVETTRVIPL